MVKEMNKRDKLRMEEVFQGCRIREMEQALWAYEEAYPFDRDLKFYKCVYHMMQGELEKAQEIIADCLRRFPTSYEANYYQACIYQEQEMLLEAMKYYRISLGLHEYFGFEPDDMIEDANEQSKVLAERIGGLMDEYAAANDLESLQRIEGYLESGKTHWGLFDEACTDAKREVLGQECQISDREKRYVGVYRSPAADVPDKKNLDLIFAQGEFLKIFRHGTEVAVCGEAEEYLLPIAAETRNTFHCFGDRLQKHTVLQRSPQNFNYYRIKNNTCVVSDKRVYYGNPVPLEHRADRKKLVLSFFVDGLAQSVICGDKLLELMPNTYQFFKKGTVCTRTYSTAEWTYPSLASYVTGLDTLSHMLFHNITNTRLPENVPLLYEYLKRKDYFTSKIDGEWRSTYVYGYTRGLDQYVYQHQLFGARAEQEIMNIIEHIEAFKDTDQYLWMCIGDLHDIADEFDVSLAVQNRLSLEEREYEQAGNTSVKQNYSKNKKAMYIKTLQYLDILFGFLFSYIEKNYSDDEMLISLFADHGQGYLVPPDGHFLSKERTNVAFMFRGGNVSSCVSDELMSTADYLPIMCKLLGIEQDDVPINGRLPKTFGGASEREYTITESLHPGDFYYAAANTKDFVVYFDNPEKTDNEGRFRLGDYSVYGFYENGEAIKDTEILQKYERIFLSRIAENIIYE